jgi:hypothetical protein
VLTGLFVTGWYLYQHRTSPFTQLIPISVGLVILGFLLFVLALLADMLGRHRRISEELLYLARRRIYSNRRTVRASLQALGETPAVPSLHDSWSLPVMKSIPKEAIEVPTPEPRGLRVAAQQT